MRGGDVHKAAGEIRVVGRKRRLDLPFNRAGVIPQDRIDLHFRQFGGIVLRGQHVAGLICVRPEHSKRRGANRDPCQ